MLIRHQPLGLRLDPCKERLRQLLIQKPVAILAEYRVIPHRVVDLQSDEPAEQQVVVELLHQQPLAANRIEHLQQQRPEQPLRSDRRPALGRIQAVEFCRHLRQHQVHQLTDRTQRMIYGHTFFQGHIAEHSGLKSIIVSTHI